MYISEKYYEKKFQSETGKEALLQCTKWLAQNVLNEKVEAGEIHFKIEKECNNQESLPTFILTLYSAIKQEEIKSKFCEACESFNTTFYMRKDNDCNSCKMRAYFEQIKAKFLIINEFRKKKLP